MPARILIVEDDQIIAADLRLRVEGLGHEVIGISISGEEAIELAWQFKPDLVLMDIQLDTAINGVEAARIIQEHTGASILFVTAFPERRVSAAVGTLSSFAGDAPWTGSYGHSDCPRTIGRSSSTNWLQRFDRSVLPHISKLKPVTERKSGGDCALSHDRAKRREYRRPHGCRSRPERWTDRKCRPIPERSAGSRTP